MSGRKAFGNAPLVGGTSPNWKLTAVGDVTTGLQRNEESAYFVAQISRFPQDLVLAIVAFDSKTCKQVVNPLSLYVPYRRNMQRPLPHSR